MLWYILLLNLFVNNKIHNSQTNTILWYDIIYKEEIIGNLKAIKTIDNSNINYTSSSTINFKLLKEVAINYNFNVNFEADILKNSDVKILVNAKEHANTITQKTATKYKIVKDNKTIKSLAQSINYSTILLYFQEPKTITSCYSEQDGSFNSIIKLEEHCYKKINSKGKENTYCYENGVLTKAQIDGGIIKFKMLLRR